MLSSAFVCLFVCLSDYAITIQPTVTKFGGKAAYRTQKKRLNFGDNDNDNLYSPA